MISFAYRLPKGDPKVIHPKQQILNTSWTAEFIWKAWKHCACHAFRASPKDQKQWHVQKVSKTLRLPRFLRNLESQVSHVTLVAVGGRNQKFESFEFLRCQGQWVCLSTIGDWYANLHKADRTYCLKNSCFVYTKHTFVHMRWCLARCVCFVRARHLHTQLWFCWNSRAPTPVTAYIYIYTYLNA